MIASELARVVAIENSIEDLTGFYELVWDLNTRFPDALPEEKVAAAVGALRELLAEGLIEVYRTRWVSSDAVLVPDDIARSAIGNIESYLRPGSRGSDEFLGFVATARGEAEWRALDTALLERARGGTV